MGKGHCVALSVLIVYLAAFCCAEETSENNKSAVTQTWAEKLKKDLMTNYDRSLRPTQHYNVTNVEVKLTITHVDVDEENSIFSIYGWLKMDWLDLRMTWNPVDYGGLQSFIVPSYFLWDPELRLNSATLESTGSTHYSTSNIRIESNGTHHCASRVNLKTFCEMNFRNWPFDTQHCVVMLGKSASSENDEIRLNTIPGEADRLIHTNPSWKVINIVIEQYHAPLEEDNRNYVGVQYGIYIQRKAAIFHSTVIAPAVVFILMLLTNFWLPPTASEKILLNCINAALVCVFLLYFTVNLPLLATRTPLVVLFFSNSLYLNAFCLIISVIVVNMAKARHSKPVHPYIKSFIELPCVNIFVWTGHDLKEGSDEEDWTGELKTDPITGESCSSVDEATQARLGIQRDWIHFSVALERITFLIYVFIYSVMAAYYLH